MTSNIELYKKYREEGKNLNSQLLELAMDYAKDAALALGVLEEDLISLEDAQDQDTFFDFLIRDFAAPETNQTALQTFAASDSYKELSHIQKEIIEAGLKATPSLYLVKSTDKESCSIKLFDVFNSFKEIEIIDLGLSQTLKEKKHYIFTRCLQLEGFGMTTGPSAIFDSSKFKKIEKKYRQMSKTLKGLSTSHKRILSFFQLNHHFGIPVAFNENTSPSN